MTEPTWLVDVRGRVQADPELQRALLLLTDAAEFAHAVAALTEPPVTAKDVADAAQDARRAWLERWIS
jgi:hypothetical protein